MPNNVPIGGNFLSSMLSQMILVPHSGSRVFTPIGNTNIGTASDVVTFKPRRKRLLADATHTGYWYSTGKRQTGIEMVASVRCRWNPDLPVEEFLSLINNCMGFQLYAVLGTPAQRFEAVSSAQYYWSPSVFCEFTDPTIDVSGPVPKLIDYDMILQPNSPSFYIDGSEADDNHGAPSPIAKYLSYITARDWSF